MSAPGRHASSVLRRARAVIAVAALAVVAACGSASEPSDAVPTLRWYVGPDRVDPAALAKTCTVSSGGRYRIEVKPLPADLGTRHDRLVRRLLARDDTIDLLSLDSAFVPELSTADLLAPAPATLAAADDGAVPWLTEPQVLWFRGNVAERAGLDPSKPITWDDLIAGAQRLGITIQIDDPDGSGMADWVNALVVGSGGSIVDGPGRDAAVGLDSEAGRAAASVVEFYHDAGVGPGPSADALKAFTGSNGGFLIASASAVTAPEVAAIASDIDATSYPVIGPDSVAPVRGVSLAVPQLAPHPELSYDAIGCLTAPEQLKIVTASQPKLTARAIETGAAVPTTPYWFQVLRAIDATWRPASDVSQDLTPGRSQIAVEAAVEGTLR